MAAVLGALAEHADDAGERAGATLNDVCARTGLSRSTASRFLNALVEHEYAYRSDGATFSIGPVPAQLARVPLGHDRLAELAEPHMRRLAEDVQEAVCISILDGIETRTIHQVGVPQPVFVENWVDRRWPILTTGSAISIMSTWSPTAVAAVLDQVSNEDRAAIEESIKATRENPLSWGEDNYVKALTSVAAPILDPRGHATSALIVYGPSYRFPREHGRNNVEKKLTTIAAAISEDIY